MAKFSVFFQCTAAILVLGCISSVKSLEETYRLEEYKKRNYTWPLPEVVPNTDGWRKLMYRRLAQVERVVNDEDRYNAWISVLPQAISAPNFTEFGWGLAKAPPDLVAELQKSLRDGLPNARRESYINVITGGDVPWFIHQHDLNEKVLNELKPMHEAWAGIPLVGSLAYGLRAYTNSSKLYMHVDKTKTHIISCILHVDHSEDSEPWPIFIEGFDGSVNEVVLESGDMLFYESSKCIHGRPRPFKGSWYSSLFVHYRPVDWDMEQQELENHFAVPPHWRTAVEQDPALQELSIVGTSMKEVGCPDEWCSTKNTVKWNGPAIEGEIIDPSFTKETGRDEF